MMMMMSGISSSVRIVRQQQRAVDWWMMLLLSCCCILLVTATEADTEADTEDILLCRLVAFVPFSYLGQFGTYSAARGADDQYHTNNIGYAHMAAIIMAMQQFNARDPSVVPELANPEYQHCPVQFDMDMEKQSSSILGTSAIYDSETLTFAVGEDLLQELVSLRRLHHHPNQTETTGQHIRNTTTTTAAPCQAAVGGYHDYTGSILSVLAASANIPLTMPRTFNNRLTDPWYSPYSNQVYPDQFTTAQALVQYLRYIGRDKYVSLLYTHRDTSAQQHDAVSALLGQANISHRSHRYSAAADQGDNDDDYVEENDRVLNEGELLVPVLTRIRQSGFNTIIVMTEYPEDETHLIAIAADKVGINTDDYFWMFVGVDVSVFYFFPADIDELDLKLLSGSAILSPLEGFLVDEEDRFLKSWQAQNSTLVEQLNRMHPLNNGDQYVLLPDESGLEGVYLTCDTNCTMVAGSFVAEADYFQKVVLPVSGAGFMYDAVMATGMGACLAYQNKAKSDTTGNWTGAAHLDGIRSVDFTGATGRVQIGNQRLRQYSRNPEHIKYGVVNLFPRFEDEELTEEFWTLLYDDDPDRNEWELTDVLQNNEDGQPEWENVRLFRFRSGKSTPPNTFEPDHNYLPVGVRVAGLTLMSIVFVASGLSSLWILTNRKHRIVRVAQPSFLYLLCFGAFVTAIAILPLSYDESYGWTADQLSMGCMSVLWLVSVGQIITYGALFGKLWRVNRVLQFRRATVHVRNVAWPMGLVLLITVTLLSVMSAVGPLAWERKIIDEDTDESIGKCESCYYFEFIFPIGSLILILILCTAFMAWKTNDVDASLSESWWIFSLMVVQFEVIVIGIPVYVILRDLSTSGSYFGLVFMIWTFPTSTLSLIMLPKMVAHRRAVRGEQKRKLRQSGTGACHVTGLAGSGNGHGHSDTSSRVQEDAILAASETHSGSHDVRFSIPENKVDMISESPRPLPIQEQRASIP